MSPFCKRKTPKQRQPTRVSLRIWTHKSAPPESGLFFTTLDFPSSNEDFLGKKLFTASLPPHWTFSTQGRRAGLTCWYWLHFEGKLSSCSSFKRSDLTLRGEHTCTFATTHVCELGFSKHYAAKTKLCRGWDKTATAFGFPCFLILCIPWNNLLVKRWQVNVTKLNLQSTLRVMSASLRPVPPVSPGSAAGLE